MQIWYSIQRNVIMHDGDVYVTYYAVRHQGPLCKACQHICWMMFVVRHPRQSCVKCHHNQCELKQGTQQAGSSPGEPSLQVQL